MPSSISNSDSTASGSTAYRRMPHVSARVLGAALLLAAAFCAALEWRLARLDVQYSPPDDSTLWLLQRDRAATLGTRALILVGASRMQTDVDLDLLRARTHLEPVQLAIDGSSFWPVLDGLACDPRIDGTVLVDFMPSAIAHADDPHDQALAFANLASGQRFRARYAGVEDRLAMLLHAHLRSYAEGMRPLDSVLERALAGQPRPQVALLRPDRSLLLDFDKINRATQYLRRVLADLGGTVDFPDDADYATFEAILRQHIEAQAAVPNDLFLARAQQVAAAARVIEARGGKVVFVHFPTAGLVRDLDQRRYPRAQFWDRFVAISEMRTLDLDALPTVHDLPLPDGSHLDRRDRTALTQALLDALPSLQTNGADARRN